MISRTTMGASAELEISTYSGPICPADPRAKKSEHKEQNNWRYYNGTEWTEGKFDFIDDCHPKGH